MGALLVVIPGDPVPLGRPRFGRGGRVYTPTRSRDYQNAVALCVRAAAPTGRDRDALFGLRLTFYRSTAQRLDLDNLIKSILDGITKAERVWADDSQVREIHARLLLRAVNPRAEIEIYQLPT